MDELKNFVDKNRSMFDNLEPENGHFERFLKKMQVEDIKPKSKIVRFRPVQLIKAASVCLLIALSSLYVKEHFFDKKEPIIYMSAEQSEAQQFYITQVNQKVNTIEDLSRVMNDEDKIQLKNELDEMDKTINDLMEQLKLTPDDPRLIEALLKHYKTKVNILNSIIKNLNQVKQAKSNTYETVEL